jgi:regulatory helix-turn-helix LysR family protein
VETVRYCISRPLDGKVENQIFRNGIICERSQLVDHFRPGGRGEQFLGSGTGLKMPTSTVSRRIAELETQLGVRLIERSTRSLRLTDIGLEVLEHAQRSAELSEAIDNIASNHLSKMCVEVVKWWKRRMEQYGPPPLANLISYIPDRERLWRATQVLWFPLSDLCAIRGRLHHSVQSIDDDRPKKAA